MNTVLYYSIKTFTKNVYSFLLIFAHELLIVGRFHSKYFNAYETDKKVGI